MSRGPHSSMQFHPGNPLVEIGDAIELLAPARWRLDARTAEEVVVPAGARGTVQPWALPGWPLGIAFHFEGHAHPSYHVFPMLTFRPGASRYPDKFHLLNRKAS